MCFSESLAIDYVSPIQIDSAAALYSLGFLRSLYKEQKEEVQYWHIQQHFMKISIKIVYYSSSE
jgi:hypothetical protein